MASTLITHREKPCPSGRLMTGIAGFTLATGLLVGAVVAPAPRLELTDATRPLLQTLSSRLGQPEATRLGQVAPTVRSSPAEANRPGIDPKGPYLQATADFLNLPPGELIVEQWAGKSLAEIARAQGKSVDDLKAVMLTTAEGRLSQATEGGRLSPQQTEPLRNRLEADVAQMVGSDRGRSDTGR